MIQSLHQIEASRCDIIDVFSYISSLQTLPMYMAQLCSQITIYMLKCHNSEPMNLLPIDDR